MGTVTYPNGTEELCKQETTSNYQTFWIVTISVILFCNVFLLIAIVRSWAILRRNVVNRYLVSCLLSTVAFCGASAFEMLHTIYHADETFLGESVLQGYNASHTLHTITMQRYAYRKGLLPTLALVMQYNISALIYAVSESALFIGRHTNPDIIDNEQMPKAWQNVERKSGMSSWKKKKPVLVCVLSWVLPLACSVPVAFGWNCVEHCKCLPAYRWTSSCQPDVGDTRICSRTWLPVSRSFVFFISVMSWTAIILNFLLLIWTIRKFYRTHAPRNLYPFPDTANAVNTNSVSDATASYFPKNIHTSIHSLPGMAATRTPVGLRHHSDSDDRIASGAYRTRIRPPMDRTIKLLIAVSISMFISVTPMIMIWFLDVILLTNVSNGIGFPIALSFSYGYAAVLPFILLKFMFGLQKAFKSCFFKCPCLHTTVVTSSPT